MEENKQSENIIQEEKAVIKTVQSRPKKVVTIRKPAVKNPIVRAKINVVSVPVEVMGDTELKSINPSNEIDELENTIDNDIKKLDKKNLKKLKKMSDKTKEKEKKAKEKQKEKEKKAKKKKKEKAKEKLKEKKAKKKAADKKKKSKKK